MKKSYFALGMVITLIIGSLAFTSCQKKNKNNNNNITTTTTTTGSTTSGSDTETQTVVDNNLAENIANDIESIGAQTSENENGVNYRTATSCYSITANWAAKIFTVDFGTGCLGNDGHLRKGKLIYDFSASAANVTSYRNPGFHMSVTAQNYSVDGYSVTINNKTVANTTPTNIPTGANPGTNLTWGINADLTILKPSSSSGTITWVCNRTKELVNTSDTNCYKGQNHFINWTKAIVKLNGTANGTNANASSYSVTATDLLIDFQCSPDPNYPYKHPIIGGTLAYTPGNHPTRTINYGNGVCDLLATISVGNITATITLQ